MNEVTAGILDTLCRSVSFISGEELCREFSITRSAVWKHVGLLRDEGYLIEAVTGRGYRMAGLSGKPVRAEVGMFLETGSLGRNFIFRHEAVSTNQIAKALAQEGAPEGTVVAADAQTGGRGRMGRSWSSPPGVNLYFSFILRPELPSVRIPQLTLLVAAAIHRALVRHVPGARTKVKWPNDILLNDRKVCGVLCEMQSEPDLTHFVIVGVGINVNQSGFSPELQHMATSLALETGGAVCRPELLAGVLNHFEPLYREWLSKDDLSFIVPYLEEHSYLNAREVAVDQHRQTIRGKVAGIAPGGELILLGADGRPLFVASGEAHIRKEQP
ncbi:MAG: biotin--[acetyl-CoA-carboxylase] ligase [Chlorobiaceae bacterium]|nr:biotin--[acetyl-CoA-carboxylase] ligase [Chlorobiaceae bacterium]